MVWILYDRDLQHEKVRQSSKTIFTKTDEYIQFSSCFLDTMPVVYYGLFKEIMILKSYGTTTTYNASDMCGSPANAIGYRDPGFIHDVLLKVLLPNTRYYYKFGSGEV